MRENPAGGATALSGSVDAIAAVAVTGAVENRTRVVAHGARIARGARALDGERIARTVAAADGDGAAEACSIAVSAGPARIAGARAVACPTVGAIAVFAKTRVVAVGTPEMSFVARAADAVGIVLDLAELTAPSARAAALAGCGEAGAVSVADGAATCQRPHAAEEVALAAPVPVVALAARCSGPIALDVVGGVAVATSAGVGVARSVAAACGADDGGWALLVAERVAPAGRAGAGARWR